MIDDLNLAPTPFIDTQTDSIRAITKTLEDGCSNTIDLAIKIFNYVRDEIKYSIDMSLYTGPEDFKASATLQQKKGFCIPKAILLVALLRTAGLSSRLHFADIINHRSPDYLQELMGTNVFHFHGYAEVLLNNQWLKLTPSFDTKLCKKHNYPLCEFSGYEDATLSPNDLFGQPFIEYIKDRGIYSDFPFTEMISIFQEKYRGHFSE